MFLTNRTIQPLHANNAPKNPAMAIFFGTHYHTPATNTVYLASPANQRLQRQFQPAFTGRQCTADSTTAVMPLMAENCCDFHKLLPFLRNLILKGDIMISPKKYL